MVKEWGNHLPGMFNSAITPWEIPWPTSPLLASQQQLFHISKFGFSWKVQPAHVAAFLIFRAHLEEESILPRNSTSTAFLPYSVRTRCSLKLKVPDYHWPAQPACSRTYFTLVSGLRRPPRSFVCLHMLGFSVPTIPEGLHHNGSWPSSEGTLPLGDGGPAVFHLRENLFHMFCFSSWGGGQIRSVLVMSERPMLSCVRWPSYPSFNFSSINGSVTDSKRQWEDVDLVTAVRSEAPLCGWEESGVVPQGQAGFSNSSWGLEASCPSLVCSCTTWRKPNKPFTKTNVVRLYTQRRETGSVKILCSCIKSFMLNM